MNAVIVHRGSDFPLYIIDCIEQFFLFNKTIPLYIIVDKEFSELEKIKEKEKNFIPIYTTSLKKTKNYIFFLSFNRLTKNTWRGGFWRYVVERFFLIECFMQQYNVNNIFHFEYDNMIYTDIINISPAFNQINKIALPADCDNRCVPSIVFIPSAFLIKKFNTFYNLFYTLIPRNDMRAFSLFRQLFPNYCETLPVIPQSYADDKEELLSLKGNKARKKKIYFNYFSSFNGIFDAAAFGQYIGGIDPRNTQETNTEGFINEKAVYSPADFSIFWAETDKLKYPLIKYKDFENFPIFNLHIHSKNLKKFRSEKK